MKKIYLLFLPFLIILNANAQFQWTWANSFNGSAIQIAAPKVVANPSGGFYITGTFEGTKNFGSISLTATGASDAYLAKCDNSGNFIWAKRFGGIGSGTTYGNGVCVDNVGNVYLCGDFTNYLVIDTNYVLSLGQTDIFIVKLDASGNILDYARTGGYTADNGQGLTADLQGNIYMCGSFSYRIYFDNDSVSSYGQDDIYLAKLNSNLNFQWLKKAGGNNADVATAIRFGNNRLYLCGSAVGSAGGSICTFGTHTITAVYADVFIAKYDLAGANLWVKKAGGQYNDLCNDLGLDQYGNAFITGGVIGNASFPPFNLSAGNYLSAFIAKYDSAGVCMYAKKGSSSSQPVTGRSIATDIYGNSVIVGDFAGTLSFGSPYILVSAGLNDIFAAHYNQLGNCTGAIKAGGTNDDIGTSACWLPSNEVITVGNFGSTALFGSNTLNTPAGNSFASYLSRLPNSFTGINENQNTVQGFSVFPNPANDWLNIDLTDFHIGTVESIGMFNAVGQLVIYKNVNDIHQNNITLKTNELPAGLYTMQIWSSKGCASLKVQILN